MTFKGKSLFVVFGAVFLIVVIGVGAYIGLSNMAANNFDPVTESGTSNDATDLTPVSNPENPYPTGSPYTQITPIPTATWNPGQLPTAPASSTKVTAQVWQTLYIQNVAGSAVKSYWVNPPKPFNPASILASPDGNDFYKVDSYQNNIYAKIHSDVAVSSWSFSCRETIAVYSKSGSLLSIVANDQLVQQTGGNLPLDQNAYITGASASASDLQQILRDKYMPYTSGVFRITLSQIYLRVTLADGVSYSLIAPSGNADNVLNWQIQLTTTK